MTNSKPTFDFDVDFNFSLDKLRAELQAITTQPHTKIFIDLSGPGGGNTNVHIHTELPQDIAAIHAWMLEHHID